MTISKTWTLFGPNYVPYRILLLAKMIDRVSAASIRASSGLSLAEWRVLAHVAVLEEASPSSICAAGAIDRAEVSRAIKTLGNKDFISRRNDPDHGKRHLVSLTEKGRNIHQKVRSSRAAFFTEITVDLSSSEIDLLDNALLKIAKRVEHL